MEIADSKAIANMPEEPETKPLTFRELSWRRFRRHKMAMAGAVMLVLLVWYLSLIHI